MRKTIKIIDLLIKINNFNNGKSESLPNKIKWNTIYYYLKEDAVDGHFYYDNSSHKTFIAAIYNFTQLNDEVEIIEEDKKIDTIRTYYDEKLEEYVAETFTNNNYYKEIFNSKYDEMVLHKVNELINKINNKEDK